MDGKGGARKMERDEFSFCVFCDKIKEIYREIRKPKDEQQVEKFLNDFLAYIFFENTLDEKEKAQFINRKNKCYVENSYPK